MKNENDQITTISQVENEKSNLRPLGDSEISAGTENEKSNLRPLGDSEISAGTENEKSNLLPPGDSEISFGTENEKSNLRPHRDLEIISDALLDTPKFKQLAREFRVDLTVTARQAFASGSMHLSNSFDEYLRAGCNFIMAKELLGHGKWESYLKEEGESPQRAAEAMRCVRRYIDLPPDQQKKIEKMPKAKAKVFMNAPQDAYDALISDEQEFREYQEANYRSAKQQIKELKDERDKDKNTIRDLKVDKETLDMRIKQLTDVKRSDKDLPDFVVEVRHEAPLLVEQAALAMVSLGELQDSYTRHTGQGGFESQEHRELVARHLYFAALQICGQAQTLLTRIRGENSRDLDDIEPSTADILDETEQRKWAHAWDDIIQRDKTEKMRRKLERKNKNRKGPGAPYKIPE